MTCPPDPPTDGYLLGPRCLSSKWVLMSAGAIPHSAQWLNWSDPIDIDSVTFKAITLRQRWTPHHGDDSDSWLATNYKWEGAEASLGCAEPVVRVRGVGRKEQGKEGMPKEGKIIRSFCFQCAWSALTTGPVGLTILHLPTIVNTSYS